ncbi:hypothetical protein LguiB_001977 [Lonicera macranthoides]
MYSHSNLSVGHYSLIKHRTTTLSLSPSSNFSPSAYILGTNGIRVSSTFPARPTPAFKSISHEAYVAQKNQLLELIKDDCEVDAGKVSTLEEIEKYVNQIKMILESMEGGELTTSGYDTAMVALVEDINGSGSPQFPSCLEWIANNQMEDGSWGAPYLFAYSDRLINTLACTVALKKWNLHPHKIQKGITFFKENFNNLANENEEHMLIGFEIAFPGLVRKARKYGIEVPDDSHPILKDINAKRDYKLSKIPKEVLHTEHTTLLFSAEGLEDLDMEKLLKLQCPDGSMLYSPASTAHVLTHTKDPNCLKYLNHVVDRSNGGESANAAPRVSSPLVVGAMGRRNGFRRSICWSVFVDSYQVSLRSISRCKGGSFRVASTFYEKTDKKGRVRGKATDKPFFTRSSAKPGLYRVRKLYYGLGRC